MLFATSVRGGIGTECEVLQEGNEVSVFDDEELGVQVIELLGRRCCVTLPCSSILRHLCLHMKVTRVLQPRRTHTTKKL